jgi:hypothetical protein
MYYGISDNLLYDDSLKNIEKEKPPLGVHVLCYCNRYEACFKKDRMFNAWHIPMIGRYIDDNGYKYFDCEGSYYKVIEWCYLPYYNYSNLE